MPGQGQKISKLYRAMIIEAFVNSPDLSQEALAKMFNVKHGTVGKIIGQYLGKGEKSKSIKSAWETAEDDPS